MWDLNIPKGYLSWSSGLRAFYLHKTTLFSPWEQQHDTIRGFFNLCLCCIGLHQAQPPGISYQGER